MNSAGRRPEPGSCRRRHAEAALVALITIFQVVALTPPPSFVCATPAWMSPGAFAEYSGRGYLNLSSGAGTCTVFPQSLTLRWEIADLKKDAALLALRLELTPPLRLKGDCYGLGLVESETLAREAELEVDLPSRRATWRGTDLGLIPLWIEGLVPGARVEVSGPEGHVLTGVVGDPAVYVRVGERLLRAFEVRVAGPGVSEVAYEYDAETGILLRLFEGEVDLRDWPFLESLGISGIELFDLELTETNVELSEVGGLLGLILAGRWIALASKTLAVASLAGLTLLTAARGGLRQALETRAGRLLLALLVAAAIFAALTTPLGAG